MLNTALGLHATLAMCSPSPAYAGFIDTPHEKTMTMISEAFADSIVYTIRASSDRFVLVVDGDAQVYTQAIGDEQDVIDEMLGYFNDDISNEGALKVAVMTDAATKATINAGVLGVQP